LVISQRQSTPGSRVRVGRIVAIFAALACVYVWYVFSLHQPITTDNESTLTHEISFAFFAAPYIVVVLGLLTGARPLALGVALGVAFYELPYSAFIAVANLVFAGGGAARIWLIPPHVALLSGALLALRFERSQLTRAAAGVFIGATYLIGLYSISHTHPDWLFMAAPSTGPPRVEESYRFLLRADACLLQYAAQHADTGFPPSFEAIRETSPQCGEAAAFSGQKSREFKVEYQRHQQKIAGYSLSVQYDSPFRAWKISLYTDESGIIHIRDRNASASSPVYYIWLPDQTSDGSDHVGSLAKALDCIKAYIFRSGVPSRLSDAFSGCKKRPAVINFRSDSYHSSGYNVSFTPLANSKEGIHGFHLEARPEKYGETGLRSYFVDQSFVIHATPEDRSATDVDIEALPCEFNTNESCPGR